MQAERIIIETDAAGKLINMPILPANKQMEAIILIKDDVKPEEKIRRRPHSDIAGKLQIKGDLLHTVAESDWA